jgi:Bacterial PH domain
VSSQHDEAPAPPDESGSPAAPDQGAGTTTPVGQASASLGQASAQVGHAAAPVGFGPADGFGPATGPPVAGPAGFGQAAPSPGAAVAPRTPWKQGADGRTVFRRGTPFVVWWVWIAFAIFNLAEIAIPDHDYFSLEFTAGVLVVTAVMYACTLRPRVVADDDGVLVVNPFQDHRIRWGALNGVYLGDSVELGCARQVPKKEKTVYCWALYSGRRSRMKAQVRAERGRTRAYGAGAARRAQAEAEQLARQDIVQLMAAEIGRRSTAEKERGVPAAVLESAWAWLPTVVVLLPALLLLGLVLGR